MNVFQYLACLLAIGLLPKGVSLFLEANYLGGEVLIKYEVINLRPPPHFWYE